MCVCGLDALQWTSVPAKDRLRIHSDPDQDKAVNVDEPMNK